MVQWASMCSALGSSASRARQENKPYWNNQLKASEHRKNEMWR